MTDIASFFVFVALTAFTPGPNNIMSMGNAGRYGFRKSLRFNLGIWFGFSIVMIACAVFSATLFAFMPRVRFFMKVVGAAYLLYLAWHTFSQNLHAGKHGATEPRTNESKPLFASGALLQAVNPKIYIYGITSMSSWILPSFSSPWIIAGFAFFLAFVGFLATLCWSAFGSLFARVFSGQTKILNVILAMLLVYCAVSLFL